MNIVFRKATIGDRELLFRWRNDPETFKFFLSPSPVSWAEHFSWFNHALESTERTIYLAEIGGKIIGQIRVDQGTSHEFELSWTVAPDMRGKGAGKAMLIEARRILPGVLIAKILSGNVPSLRIAEVSGFVRIKEENGIVYLRSEK